MKQRNAFPPNYIHSLDSSHMMLTSLHCLHAGVTFVSVHDCYWTHACTVDEMNRVRQRSGVRISPAANLDLGVNIDIGAGFFFSKSDLSSSLSVCFSV